MFYAQKNIGWNEYLNHNCVVQNYHNDDEWVKKIKYLLKKKIENKKILKKLITSSEEKIYKTIRDIIE